MSAQQRPSTALRAASQPCPVEGCPHTKRRLQVCCRACWFRLPAGIRGALWRVYRAHPGSARHLQLVHDAIELAGLLRREAQQPARVKDELDRKEDDDGTESHPED